MEPRRLSPEALAIKLHTVEYYADDRFKDVSAPLRAHIEALEQEIRELKAKGNQNDQERTQAQ
jgi:hypothetical protein